jgi:hypothetical protein
MYTRTYINTCRNACIHMFICDLKFHVINHDTRIKENVFILISTVKGIFINYSSWIPLSD